MHTASAYNHMQDAYARLQADTADTVNTFKHRLDKFWSNREVIYNYKVDLRRSPLITGIRSIIN